MDKKQEQALVGLGDDFMTILPQHREVKLYKVFEPELDGLHTASNATSLYVSFFGIFFGVFVSVAVTISTVSINNMWVYAAYMAAFFVFLFGSVLLGILAYISYKSAEGALARIKAGRLTPSTDQK